MSSLVSRLGRGAVKNARVHLKGLRSANSDNGTNWNVFASLHVNNSTDANDVPSLRTKQEKDINALEWGTFSCTCIVVAVRQWCAEPPVGTEAMGKVLLHSHLSLLK